MVPSPSNSPNTLNTPTTAGRVRGGGIPDLPPPPQVVMGQGGWGSQGSGIYPSGPPQAPGMGSLGISDAAVHTFTAALQGVVVARVG